MRLRHSGFWAYRQFPVDKLQNVLASQRSRARVPLPKPGPPGGTGGNDRSSLPDIIAASPQPVLRWSPRIHHRHLVGITLELHRGRITFHTNKNGPRTFRRTGRASEKNICRLRLDELSPDQGAPFAERVDSISSWSSQSGPESMVATA